ncbi:MAG TPA: hypothetical protein VG276_20010 [Actinomycetes bacterium]|jgi:hypothetical protein|nr:hypothetical protein [Actinomycetes bacterium]
MFVAGPYVACYRAEATGRDHLLGVRCVLFANLLYRPGLAGVGFVWYGEDATQLGAMRHIGEAYMPASGSRRGDPLPGLAVALDGDADGDGAPTAIDSAAGLQLTVDPSAPATEAGTTLPRPPEDAAVPGVGPTVPIPPRIRVTGAWRQEWILEPSGVVDEYTSPLPPISAGGPGLDEFEVRNRDGTRGHGLRVMLASGSWLGAGTWRDVPYLHLGTFIGDPTANGRIKFGAADICHERGFCGAVPWGAMLLRPAPRIGPGVWEMLGAWTEEWRPRGIARLWRPPGDLSHLTIKRR